MNHIDDERANAPVEGVGAQRGATSDYESLLVQVLDSMTMVLTSEAEPATSDEPASASKMLTEASARLRAARYAVMERATCWGSAAVMEAEDELATSLKWVQIVRDAASRAAEE